MTAGIRNSDFVMAPQHHSPKVFAYIEKKKVAFVMFASQSFFSPNFDTVNGVQR